MSKNNILKARISNEFSKATKIIFFTYEILFIILFLFVCVNIRGSALLIIGFIFGSLTVIVILPLVCYLIANRKRKLTELSVSDIEVVGSYTAFIPVAKIALRMPIEKIDSVSVVNSSLFFFAGKTIRILSTSSSIKIPYVLNADEIVTYISRMIEDANGGQNMPAMQKGESKTTDYTASLKELAELKDAGIITEEEFNQKKKELLIKI